MVVRANKKFPELGGHIGTFASAATLYDVGMNHFWRAKNNKFGGDLIYFQGHSAPGMYARAFLEGRLSEKQLDNFRQEVNPGGLSSYPHPWLMSQGCGYEDKPPGFTSCLKLSNCFSLNLPSKNALAYIPGALWP